jgi:catechol 2,3-dioxygenase-like lactoylglutathione lyase family enzyme
MHAILQEANMFENADTMATVAVKDVKTAAKFYEGTLGLKSTGNDEAQGRVYKSGNALILVYQSNFAGTNKATAATWAVDNVEKVVEALKTKGVKFEHYDMPGITRQGDIHVAGKRKNAWFKDPDGNILSVVNR